MEHTVVMLSVLHFTLSCRYNEKLKEKYGQHPQVSRIARHRQVISRKTGRLTSYNIRYSGAETRQVRGPGDPQHQGGGQAEGGEQEGALQAGLRALHPGEGGPHRGRDGVDILSSVTLLCICGDYPITIANKFIQFKF